jgi:hypothetical protein
MKDTNKTPTPSEIKQAEEDALKEFPNTTTAPVPPAETIPADKAPEAPADNKPITTDLPKDTPMNKA